MCMDDAELLQLGLERAAEEFAPAVGVDLLHRGGLKIVRECDILEDAIHRFALRLHREHRHESRILVDDDQHIFVAGIGCR